MRKKILSGVLMALLLVPAAGCDFFKSSGPTGRVSPFISNLQVSRRSVRCGQSFDFTFRHEDPQDDIEFLRLTFRHGAEGTSFVEEVFWEQGDGLDLSESGRATFTYEFECGIDHIRGGYVIEVILIDDNGHESNTRSVSVDLLTS